MQPWWLGHLERPQGSGEGSSAGESEGSLRVLRWAYGAVANASAAQITERRRELLGGRTADRALMDLYEEVAQLWRRLNEIGTKKSHLQGLRFVRLSNYPDAPTVLRCASGSCCNRMGLHHLKCSVESEP